MKGFAGLNCKGQQQESGKQPVEQGFRR